MDSLDQIAISFGGSTDFEVIPEDVYEVAIAAITPKEKKKFQSEELETVFRFEFSILEGEHKGSKLFKDVRPKLGIKPKPSHLYNIWSAVLGKQPGEDSFADFHVSGLIGKQIRVTVTNSTKGDNTYSNVETFMTSKSAKAAPEPKAEVDVDEVLAEMEKK